MNKSPKKGYWYHRDHSSRSQDYGTAGVYRTNQSDAQNQELILAKKHESSVNFLGEKAVSLQANVQKITKMQDFFQIMCAGEFAQIGIRCYEHNNQLILYCINDHKLLCPNCMYSNNAPYQHQVPEIDKNIKSSKKKMKANNLNTGTHGTHDVKQISKASAQITSDVKISQFQVKQKITLLNSCRMGWEKMKENFDKTKQSILVELDREYDKLQQQISTKYMQIKKQIVAISQPYISNLQKIITAYKIITKLVIPSRYPVITVKHSWIERVKNYILPEVQTVQPSVHWLKSYQANAKLIIKKILRKNQA